MPDDFIDVTSGDLFPILEAMDQGVLITDPCGYILYYNKSHAQMDGLDSHRVKNMKLVDVYELDESESIVMRCLKSNKPIINFTHLYTAKNGRVVNSINSVFPLKKKGRIIGAINFVKNYEYLDDIINRIDGSYKKSPVINETRFSFSSIIGKAPLFQDVLNKAKLSANSPTPVMLYGETGTGKELLAQSIHNYSHRKKASYMAVNCAAIPETLLEGILFGSTRGAFTGAMEKPGLFEQANGGTVYLDEVNSMPVGLQGKMLRVLQEKKVRRIGGEKEIPLDIKLISSINVPVQTAISTGLLRQDLFYRLGVIFLEVPPLRKRASDISILADHFIDKHNRILDKTVQRFSAELQDLFAAYDWPGNVRELENMIEGAMNMVGTGRVIEKKHLASGTLLFSEDPAMDPQDPFVPSAGKEGATGTGPQNEKPGEPGETGKSGASRGRGGRQPESDEKEHLISELKACGGSITQTAQRLKISRQTLYKKLKKYGIDKNRVASDIEKKRIEKTLEDSMGNISRAAETLSISRQLLAYKMKKYNISKNDYRYQSR